VIVPMRDASEESDLAGQIADGALVLVAFASLRVTLWHASVVAFRLIDLALAPEPLTIAEQLNQASDPRWSVSILLVTLPVFLIAFRMLSARLENNPSLHHGKFFVLVLALLVLDTIMTVVTTIPGFLVSFLSETAALSSLLKIATIATVYGAFFAYLVCELRLSVSQ